MPSWCASWKSSGPLVRSKTEPEIRIKILKPIFTLSQRRFLCGLGATIALVAHLGATESAQPPISTCAIADFKPLLLSAGEEGTVDLWFSDELERIPRNWVRVLTTVRAEGETVAGLVFVDVLRREYRGKLSTLQAGKEGEIGAEMEQAGRPVSLLRGVRLYYKGGPLRIANLRLLHTEETLPRPDVTVQGTFDDSSIQKALDALGPRGGVVCVPAGNYVIRNQIKVPVDNVTIYGDGAKTTLQGTWFETKALILAEKRQNLRLTRLHLRSLPITCFRGYSEAKYALPGDAGRPSVHGTGIELLHCHRTRVDHCEVELFGHAGLWCFGGSENLVDHCFFHENFHYGDGYGVCATATKDLFIEDNSFENHRHGIAAGNGASYTARFNRMIKDAAVLADWKQNADAINQLRAHDIDAHPGCKWIFAHDNYVAMRNALMGGGAYMRGNPAWLCRNVFENCVPGIFCTGQSDDVWTWDNRFIECKNPKGQLREEYSDATGAIHFRQRPPQFREIPYPCELNRFNWWPGRPSETMQKEAR